MNLVEFIKFLKYKIILKEKNLTTHQIEHILKNNVPIPKDHNVSFFKRSISNPISKAGKGVSGFYNETTGGVERFFKRTKRGATGLYDDTTGGVGNFFIGLWRSTGNIGIGILNMIPKYITQFPVLFRTHWWILLAAFYF